MGPAIGEVARRLGKPFMPWQQYVADVIGEVDPVTGRLAYSEWGLTVPRQSGKSTFVLAKAVHRCSASGFFGSRQKVVYTAQTRQKAREKWEEDYAEELLASRSFKSRVAVHKGNGNEHIRFTNGSRFGIEASTEKAGHGGTIDEAYIDEAFAQADGRLEQAFGPAMITRVFKQLAWISTAGWSDGSPYLQGKVRTGRAQVESGSTRGLAYFEWSASEDADPADRDVWRGCMPALGHTITEDAIAAELDKALREGKLSDFRRAYLNQWVPKVDATDSVVDMDLWARRGDPTSQVLDPVVFAVDVSPDRAWSSVAVAGDRADGVRHAEVVDRRAGTGWVADRVAALTSRWDALAVVLDASGPAASLIPELRDVGVEVETTSARDMAAACGSFYDAVVQGSFRHIDQPELTDALRTARRRDLSGAWAWSRKDPAVDISPLVAVTVALYTFAAKRADSDQGGWVVSL